MVKVKIKRLSDNAVMPHKMHDNDAGFDLYVPRDTELSEGRQVIPLEFSMELPHGYAATIQPRSGFSSKGIECEYYIWEIKESGEFRIDADVIRGLVDENYRGVVGVIINVHRLITPAERFILKRGTRIAQMQIVEVLDVELEESDALSDTDRGTDGFGSTGL